MVNPTEVFWNLFTSFREGLQREIAFITLSEAPDVERDVDEMDSDLIEDFREWLTTGKTESKVVLAREACDKLDLGDSRKAFEAVRDAHLTPHAIHMWQMTVTE